MVIDRELSLVKVRLDRWARADKRDRLGQGYPTASPIYCLMRDGTAIQAAPGRLDAMEQATELDLEIEETQVAVDRLPDYLREPLVLAYLDPRDLDDKLRLLNVSERKLYELLNFARHRLVGLLLNQKPRAPVQLYAVRY
jgi:DNA-directed RNA polymerase specialized sigma24 family protein